MASLPCNARECSPSEGMCGAGCRVILIYAGAPWASGRGLAAPKRGVKASEGRWGIPACPSCGKGSLFGVPPPPSQTEGSCGVPGVQGVLPP